MSMVARQRTRRAIGYRILRYKVQDDAAVGTENHYLSKPNTAANT